MEKLDSDKKRRFTEYILDEYHRTSIVERLTKVGRIATTDGTFTKIGIRPLIDVDIFTESNVVPEVSGLGRIISSGEMDFFVKMLLNNEKIEVDEIRTSELTPKRLQASIGKLNPKILVPIGFQTIFLKNRSWLKHISFSGKQMKFNSYYDIHSIYKKISEDRIIVLDELALIWIKKEFFNLSTKEKDVLDIEISEKPKAGKVDVLIQSINSVHYYPESIRIIKLIGD